MRAPVCQSGPARQPWRAAATRGAAPSDQSAAALARQPSGRGGAVTRPATAALRVTSTERLPHILPGCVALAIAWRAQPGPVGGHERRRDAGAVERGGLENRCTRERTVGSNPTPSANPCHKSRIYIACISSGAQVSTHILPRNPLPVASIFTVSQRGRIRPSLAAAGGPSMIARSQACSCCPVQAPVAWRTVSRRRVPGRVPRRGVGAGQPGSRWRVGRLWFMPPRRAA